MSNDPGTPDPRPAPPARSLLVTGLMIVSGIVLRPPGLCSVVGIIAIANMDPGLRSPGMIVLWIFCLAIAIAGFLLLRRALRG